MVFISSSSALNRSLSCFSSTASLRSVRKGVDPVSSSRIKSLSTAGFFDEDPNKDTLIVMHLIVLAVVDFELPFYIFMASHSTRALHHSTTGRQQTRQVDR
mmetsp:Transcript_18612/g.43595  ORF Transcript_18612/g.43595 Transcript_18612/m.43595 type:complete len:101 (-) Transcript_18612:14-316(-)